MSKECPGILSGTKPNDFENKDLTAVTTLIRSTVMKVTYLGEEMVQLRMPEELKPSWLVSYGADILVDSYILRAPSHKGKTDTFLMEGFLPWFQQPWNIKCLAKHSWLSVCVWCPQRGPIKQAESEFCHLEVAEKDERWVPGGRTLGGECNSSNSLCWI